MESEYYNTQYPSVNNRGKAILAIVVLVLLIAGAAAGAYWWQQRKINSLNQEIDAANQEQEQPKSEEEKAAESETFKEEQVPFTFTYPKEWVKMYDTPIHTNPDVAQPKFTISLLAPGTVIHTQPIGTDTTFTGARILVSGLKTTFTSVTSYVDSQPNTKNRKTKKIADIEAIEYTQANGDENRIYNAFLKDGMIYTLAFAVNKTADENYLPQYQGLVESLKF